jgi:hypothetical protein
VHVHVRLKSDTECIGRSTVETRLYCLCSDKLIAGRMQVFTICDFCECWANCCCCF